MFDSLISAIDALMEFVRQHQDSGLPPDLTEELRRLDVRLFAACQLAGLTIPDYQRPTDATLHLLGNSKLPYYVAITGGPSWNQDGTPAEEQEPWSMYVRPTLNWEQALLGLRATAEALKAKDNGHAGRSEPSSGALGHAPQGSPPAPNSSSPVANPAIDALIQFVESHSGDRPPEDLRELLTLDQEVASLCQATGLERPAFTYEGHYGDDFVGWCRIPVLRSAEVVHIFCDEGWLIGMRGLRRTAELMPHPPQGGQDQTDPLPATPDQTEQPEVKLDPAIESILDKARAVESEAAIRQRAHEEAVARGRRAYDAWLQVYNFRDTAIPAEVTGEAWVRRNAELIMALGQVLKADGWQEAVDAVVADNDVKIYALEILRKAMEGDFATVAMMVRGARDNLWFGIHADSMLREGLMYEVLGIERPPQPPVGWEGHYLKAVRTAEDFVEWIDRELLIHDRCTQVGRRPPDNDGRLVRNAFRLVVELELRGMPQEPTGPMSLQDELAVLRNLRRSCQDRLADDINNEENHGTAKEAPVPAAPGDSPDNDWLDRQEEEEGACTAPATEIEETVSSNSKKHLDQEWCFARSGKGYYVAGFGESGYLSEYKGLADIARLIATPKVSVSMMDLDGADQRLQNDRRSRQPATDANALKQAEELLRELRMDLEKAEKENNTVEADSTRKQIGELERSLRSEKGLGGKVRDLNSQFDKLRPKIHNRLQTVYKAMREANPPMNKLADHFDLSINSEGGNAFVYRPAGDPPAWQFQLDSKK